MSVPRIVVWHHEACRVMLNGDSGGRGFLSYPHTNNGFFFLLTTKIYFKISFQKSLNTLRCNFTFMFWVRSWDSVSKISFTISNILFRCAWKRNLTKHHLNQYNQSLCCGLNEKYIVYALTLFVRIARTLFKSGGCSVWSESSYGQIHIFFFHAYEVCEKFIYLVFKTA